MASNVELKKREIQRIGVFEIQSHLKMLRIYNVQEKKKLMT